MSLSFAVESLMAVADEAKPLLLEHWEEIALNRNDTPLDPDWDLYAKLDAAGVYHAVTARLDGALVGYSSYIIQRRNLHYKFCFADSDIFFLRKDQRRGLAGARLLQFAEASLKAKGVERLFTKTKLAPEHDLGPLLDRLGYAPIERVYAKRIG
jgi:GNAT superfamily N-acetyltransferase